MGVKDYCHSATNDDIRVRWCRKNHVLWRTVASYSNIPIHYNMDVEGIAVTSGVTSLRVIFENMTAKPSASEEKEHPQRKPEIALCYLKHTSWTHL